MNTIAKTSTHELEDALDELERQYHYGDISREEWADRRDAHLAWFEERGIRDERGNEPADAEPSNSLPDFPPDGEDLT